MGGEAGVTFDRVADEYDATRGGEERARLQAADVAAHLPPGRVLEVGVGTGLVARALADSARQVTGVAGVDISARMLAHARRRVPGRLVRGSALRLPFADGAFDAVVAVHVLHLVPDVAALLAEAARVLRPGGRVVAVHAEPEPDPVAGADDDLRAAVGGLAAVRARGRNDSAADVRRAADAAGLRCVVQVPSTPRVHRQTPAEIADLLERRTWSSLWTLDDDAWRAHVVPVLERLRALPDQDRPRVRSGRTTVSVLAGAGAAG